MIKRNPPATKCPNELYDSRVYEIKRRENKVDLQVDASSTVTVPPHHEGSAGGGAGAYDGSGAV